MEIKISNYPIELIGLPEMSGEVLSSGPELCYQQVFSSFFVFWGFFLEVAE